MHDPIANSSTRPHEDAIGILFCASPDYFQHVAVAAVSALENTRNRNILIHVITCEVNAFAEEKLRKSLARYTNAHVQVYYMFDGRLDHLFTDRWVSKETYLRLLAPDILPEGLTRVIYLDCDLIVLDDLWPLWTTDLGFNVLGAAPDYPRLPETLLSRERRALLGIPED